MLLLAIDTSTPTVTAGVVTMLRAHELIGAGSAAPKPFELLSQRSVTDSFAHAEKLMPLLNSALAESGRQVAAVEAIVVGLGPGPFTGLRVGIATAQALGDALNIPVYGVGSHDAAARSYLQGCPGMQARGDFLVVTDARRREVYLSAYSAEGRRLFGPAPVAPAAVPATLADSGIVPIGMIGAGAALLVGPPDLTALATELSVGLVLAAAGALLTSVVPGPLTPLYLRRPDATAPGARKSVLGR